MNKKHPIRVVGTGYREAYFCIEAPIRKEAKEKAIEITHNHRFTSEYRADYKAE